MDIVRVGVIGVGVMGTNHAINMPQAKEVKLTAVADVAPEALKAATDRFDVPGFQNSTELIQSGLCDVVVISTPHFFHAPIAIEAMRAGLHVYVEKPMAVNMSAADEMIRVAKETGKLLQVGFNVRAESTVMAAKSVAQSGMLGEIYHTLLIGPNFRAQAYYDSGAWRGTWKGEGGGVLMNQSPNDFDPFVMLGGLPSRVIAQVKTRRHRIETEDEASALIEYPNGASGLVHVSTNEIPGGLRIEICGETGKLVWGWGIGLHVWEVTPSIQEFSDTTPIPMSRPEAKEIEVQIPPRGIESHAGLLANLARAITDGEPLLCPGEEGIRGLELGNAILWSGNTGKPVDIPLDRKGFDAFLAAKQAAAK